MLCEIKMFLLITSAMCLFVPVLSRSSCSADQGPCTPLSQCQPILDEIKAGPSPMLMYMRYKLENIGCGIHDEPWVCCASTERTTIRQDVSAKVRSTDNDSTRDNPEKIDIVNGPPDVSNHPNLNLLPTSCGTIDGNRIAGGDRAELEEFPWMVILYYDVDGTTTYNCGGTLINDRYVLTAAHCVMSSTKMTLKGVVIGEYDTRSNPDCEVVAGIKSCAPQIVNTTIEEIIPHASFRQQTLFNDIALLRLAEPVDFSLVNIESICLPTSRSLQRQNLVGESGSVAGWGNTENGIRSPVLLKANLPVITNEECQVAYRGMTINSQQLCAGGVQDKDACGGDSGGPLMYKGQHHSGLRHVQRGIISYGTKKCSGAIPSVFTRVSHYMKWILDHIRS